MAAAGGRARGAGAGPGRAAAAPLRILLAPGWRQPVTRLEPLLAGFRARGLAAESLALPPAAAARAVPLFLKAAGAEAVIGGHSFGGRVATLAAAQARFAGVIAFSYPLREAPDLRTRHWPAVACPVLIVNGSEDDLADPAELRRRARLLPNGRVVVLPGAGHDLTPVLEQALDIAADFARTLRP